MKIDGRRVDGFLRDPGAYRAVLLHGDDGGLIRERARQLVVSVAGTVDDPFRVVEVERDGMGAIPAELAARAMTGGRRVVRLREATDAVLPHLQKALKGPGEGLLILEGAGLGNKSKLVTMMGNDTQTAVIACYPLQGTDLARVIKDILSAAKVRVDDEALAFLGTQLGADLAVTQREIEKLILYAGTNGLVDLEAAQKCVGDLAGLSLEDAVFAATAGDPAASDRALQLAIAEGSAPVSVLRQTLMHLQRLHRARLKMRDGLSASAATEASRPPVFFQRKHAFAQALELWSAEGLQAACQRVWEAERSCKRTGTPDDALSRSAVIGLAQRAAQAKRRGTPV